MPHANHEDMIADVRSQTLDQVMNAYNLITHQGISEDMDKIVLEQAPLLAAEAVRRETDTSLVQLMAQIEQKRLEYGSAAMPAWGVWAKALVDEAIDRHPKIDQVISYSENNPNYSSPLHAAADALNTLINPGKETP